MAFAEDFSSYSLNHCFGDETSFGRWTTVFAGYGCVSVVDVNEKRCVRLMPKAATDPAETHAALVVGPEYDGAVQFRCGMVTTRQLRLGSAPNPWEVGWIVWHCTDNAHFYYFSLKPNGWELGKRDPAHPGGQRFLATGEAPSTPIGHHHDVHVEQTGSSIRVSVDGGLVAECIDHERPYQRGRIGFYCEDSEVLFDSISAAG